MIRYILVISPFIDNDFFSYEINLDETIDGFLLKIYVKESGSVIYQYRLFDKQDRKLEAAVGFISNKGDRENERVANIMISSFRLLKRTGKTSEEYFQKAKELIQLKKYTEAHFELSNAIFHNRNNPEYYYVMAMTFRKQDNLNGIKSALKKVVSIDKDYKDAQQLLKEITREIEAFCKDKVNSDASRPNSN